MRWPSATTARSAGPPTILIRLCPPTGHPDAAAEREAQKAVDDAQAFEHALALRVRDAGSALETAREAASAVAADDLDGAVDAAERMLSETRAEAARHGVLAAQLTEAHQRAGALDDESDVRRVRVAELTTTLEHLRAQAAELEEQVAGARGEHPELAQAVAQLEDAACVGAEGVRCPRGASRRPGRARRGRAGPHAGRARGRLRRQCVRAAL